MDFKNYASRLADMFNFQIEFATPSDIVHYVFLRPNVTSNYGALVLRQFIRRVSPEDYVRWQYLSTIKKAAQRE